MTGDEGISGPADVLMYFIILFFNFCYPSLPLGPADDSHESFGRGGGNFCNTATNTHLFIRLTPKSEHQ